MTWLDLVTVAALIGIGLIVVVAGFIRLIKLDKLRFMIVKRDQCKPRHQWTVDSSGQLYCKRCEWKPTQEDDPGFEGP